MKRILILALAVAAFFTVSGCGAGNKTGGETPAAGKSIMDVLDADMLGIYEKRASELPVAVVYWFQGNGVHTESPLYGEAAVNAVLDAISEIRIVRETDISVADSDTSFRFIAADGSEAGALSFNGAYLKCGGKKYEVTGKDALVKLDFPTESDRDTLVIDSPDTELRAFLDRCSAEAPVCVRVSRDGTDEYEVTDSEVIADAISAIYSIDLDAAWEGAEPTVHSFAATFVMPDETEFTLTIYDEHVYLYDFPEPLLTWTYWTDGAEHLIQALDAAK